MREPYFIKKNGSWFRPNAQGYCDEIIGAGTFSKEEAYAYMEHDKSISIYQASNTYVSGLLRCAWDHANRLRDECRGYVE